MTEKVIDREWAIKFIKATEKDNPYLNDHEAYGVEYFCVDELKWTNKEEWYDHKNHHTILERHPYESDDIQSVTDFLMGFFNIKREELK